MNDRERAIGRIVARMRPYRGAPTIFVNGRRVPKVAVRQEHFWKALAKLYKQSAARHAHDGPKPKETPPATADTPNP